MLSFGFEDLRAAGIPARTLRSVDPAFARNGRDRLHREARRTSLFREIAAASQGELPANGHVVVPGFGPLEPNAEASVRVPLSGESLYRFNEKLARGFTFLLSGRLIDSSYDMESGMLPEEKREQFLERLRGKAISYGPGLLVTRWSSEDDAVVSGIEFQIWNRLSLYSAVAKKVPSGDPWDAVLGGALK